MEPKEKVRVLVIEDNMIIAADVSMQLTKLGYDIVSIHTKAESALEYLEKDLVDVVLMDIELAGKMNGIEAAVHILNTSKTPVIFLTSNTDDSTFQKALEAKPFAFVPKPLRIAELERTLQLVVSRRQIEEVSIFEKQDNDHLTYMEDRLFIRHKNQMIKVNLSEIQFAKADRNYCKLQTDKQSFYLSIPLISIEAKLPSDQFIRVHRSYLVNIKKIESVNENLEYLSIEGNEIPISRRLKDEVAKRIKMV